MNTPYTVILADPPWQFVTWSDRGKGRSAEQHYPTLTLEQICALPVAQLIAPDCVLFLWTCWPTLLRYAPVVLDAWGFTFKSLAWEWIKTSPTTGKPVMGLGYYTRQNAEPCLLATRGQPPAVAVHDELAVILAPRREHSRKPEEQYEKIERLYPHQRYLELFARQVRAGWDSFGNQLPAGQSVTLGAYE